MLEQTTISEAAEQRIAAMPDPAKARADVLRHANRSGVGEIILVTSAGRCIGSLSVIRSAYSIAVVTTGEVARKPSAPDAEQQRPIWAGYKRAGMSKERYSVAGVSHG